MSYSMNPVGKIHADEDGCFIELERRFIPAMAGMEGFAFIQVLWWFSDCDNDQSRTSLVENKPYRNGPDVMGVFATRSPERPNPIAVTTAQVTYLDHDRGVIGLGWIDANNGTPVLDIKPYTPSVDRVEAPAVPDWCAHWPKNVESSGEFDWNTEFHF